MCDSPSRRGSRQSVSSGVGLAAGSRSHLAEAAVLGSDKSGAGNVVPRRVLIDLHDLADKYAIGMCSVLHVGAHTGEEASAYEARGWRPVWWIEADADVIERLRLEVEPYGGEVVQAVISDRVGPVTFHVANNEQSSSVLPMGTHLFEHPEVHYVEDREMQATTIDQLWADGLIGGANFVNLDIQGAEGLALEGARNYLKGVDYLYTEVNRAELYRGAKLVDELDAFLATYRFTRVETSWTEHGWGDAFWRRGQ